MVLTSGRSWRAYARVSPFSILSRKDFDASLKPLLDRYRPMHIFPISLIGTMLSVRI